MHRQNRDALKIRPVAAAPSPEVEGRLVCRECGRLAPRGQDRPFCLEHAPYARVLRQALASA